VGGTFSQGGKKFAAQISLLLNLLVICYPNNSFWELFDPTGLVIGTSSDTETPRWCQYLNSKEQ
jgi:hypothetical protein